MTEERFQIECIFNHSLLVIIMMLFPLLLLGQSRADFEIQMQEDKELIVKILFSKSMQDLWDKNSNQNEAQSLETLEQYFKENFILYTANGQPLVIQNTGISDTNPSDNYPDYLELVFKNKNIARIENRCFDEIEGHENHHQIFKEDGTLLKEFISSSKKPVHIFPMKMGGARMFPTNHPFWVFFGIAAFIAIIFLAKRISKT